MTSLSLDWLNFWVTLISSVATVGTAFVAYVTIREMKKQREHSYVPNFAMNPSKSLWIYMESEGNELTDVFWTDEPRSPIDQSPIPRGFDIELYNIGNGVAKNIRFQYKIDPLINGEYMKFVKSIPKYEDYFSEYMLSMLSEPLKPDHDLKYDSEFSAVFINKEDDAFMLALPHFYMRFFNYIVFAALMNPSIVLSSLDPPKLKLIIFYQDIALNKFSQTFEISIAFFGNADKGNKKVAMCELMVDENINEMNRPR